MQKSTSLLLFLFTICAFCQNKVNTEKVPNWVQIQDYQTDPEVDSNEITNGSITLLADYQTHIPKQTSCTRFVNKITDNVGVQSNSSISAVYDPTYQKLVFHTIDLIRNGERIDKLDPDNLEPRKHYFYLPFASCREHVTLVYLSEKWNIINDNVVVRNDHFYYNFRVNYNRFKNDLKLTTCLKLNMVFYSLKRLKRPKQASSN